jgi:hypothetical protein
LITPALLSDWEEEEVLQVFCNPRHSTLQVFLHALLLSVHICGLKDLEMAQHKQLHLQVHSERKHFQ